MLRTLLIAFAIIACTAPRQPASSFVPARVAMDSTQIERTCVKPAHVRAGLLDCELKDQSAPIPVSLFDPLR